MATYIDRPDTLSLLGNLKSFLIGSSSEVSFELKKGGEAILSETYYPNSSGQVEIQVKDIIGNYLSTTLPTGNNFSQSLFAADFTAYLDGSDSYSFRVVNAGVRKLATQASLFLLSNWLTWQPQTKRTVWDAPEYLSFYAANSTVAKAKFYLKSGTTKTVNVASFSAGAAYTVNTTPSRLFALSGESIDDLYGIVDVWVETQSGSRLTYIQRYILEESQGDEHFYLCVNSLGGIDTYIFHGACALAPDISHENAELGDTKVVITEDAERRWEQTTGYASLKETSWIFELISAKSAWAVMDGTAEPIAIDSSSLRVSDRNNLHSCSFSFTLTEGGRYLNISRTSGTLPAIEVPSPSGEIFFLDLRLSDYPDSDLEPTSLLLLQSPFSDTWFKASLGAISDMIAQTVLAAIPPAQSNLPLNLQYGIVESEAPRTYNGSSEVTARIPSRISHLADRTSVPYLGAVGENGLVQLRDFAGNSIFPALQQGSFWGNSWNGGSVSGPLTFTAGATPSETADLEVIMVEGVRALHTRLPFYSDSSITGGGKGRGGDSSGGSSTLSGLNDVRLSELTNGQVLKYNGQYWENSSVSGLGEAAYRGVATAIGPNVSDLVPGSLLRAILGDTFSASSTVKAFVNSSIATATATFRGTFSTITALLAAAGDANDYAFLSGTDAAGNTYYDRYKYVDGTGWTYEYRLNNSSFTAQQWAAINSGATQDLMAKLSGIAAGAQANVIETIKVNGTALPVNNKAVDILFPHSVGNLGTPVFFDSTGNAQRIDYLSIHPEGGSIILPFFFNDLAGLQARGGSCTITADGNAVAIAPALFNGKPDYAYLNVAGLSSEIVINIVPPPDKLFVYASRFYIDFGSAWWAAKNITLSVYKVAITGGSESLHNTYSISDNANQFWRQDIASLPEQYKISRLVLALTDFNTKTPRISEIGLVNYSSEGVAVSYMSRFTDDAVYRHISPVSGNTTYNLGSSSAPWNIVYGREGQFSSNVRTSAVYAYNSAASINFYVGASNTKGFEVTASGLYASGSKLVMTEANWGSYIGNSEENKVGYANNALYLGGIAASKYARRDADNTFSANNTFANSIDILNGGLKLDGGLAISTYSGAPLLIGHGTCQTRNIQYYGNSAHIFSIYDSSLSDPTWNPVLSLYSGEIVALRRILPTIGSSSGSQLNGLDLGSNENQWRCLYARRWYPAGSGGPYIEYDPASTSFKVHGNLYATGYLTGGARGKNDVQSIISYSLVPTSRAVYDLGSSEREFRNAYFSATVHALTIGDDSNPVTEVWAQTLISDTAAIGKLEVGTSLTLPTHTFTSSQSTGLEAALNGTSGANYNLNNYGLTTALAARIFGGEVWVLKTTNYTLRVTGIRKNGSYYTIYCGGFVLAQYSSTSWTVYKTA